MAEATKKMTNFSISDVVNNTMDAGHTIKAKVMEKFDEATESLHQLDEKYDVSKTIKGKY